nr:PREDICTED: apolipoprotein L6 isoform X1 [Anolis carolinensis]|eukprot:XP_008108832.1 PREDICTED: apolipoprotein L6 isoform X1 [Anolis carolinensis]
MKCLPESSAISVQQTPVKSKRKEGNEVWAEMDNIHLAHFLKYFPATKKQLGKLIQRLREIANSINETNKNCTKVRIFANFTSAFSNILSIGGLALAPVTAGGSLGLCIAGIGFGAVAGVTSLATTAYESRNDKKKMETAEDLVTKCQKSLRNVMHPRGTDLSSESPVNEGTFWKKIKQLGSSVINGGSKISTAANGIITNVQALKLANANPAMKALGKQAAAAGSRSGKTIRNVRKAFAGTPLAVSKGARMLGSLSSLVFLLQDVHSIYHDSQRLKDGDSAEMAEEIREKADELEKELNSLNMFYEEKRFA